MTEDELVTAQGRVERTGKASPAAQKWANLMTEKYDALSAKDSVFGDLRNLMDMCVVAALLEKEGLWDRAGLEAPLLREPHSDLQVELWTAPKVVPPEVSFVKARRETIVSASGGVQLTPWQVASEVASVPEIGSIREKAAPAGQSLWWQ